MRCLVKHVDLGDGAVGTIPDPSAYDGGGLEWCLRYYLNESVAMQAASVVCTFDYLLGADIPAKEAIRRLRQMRAAYREQ